MKSDNPPCKIYAEFEPLFKKIDNFKNISEISSTIEKGEHLPWGYLMSTIWVFDSIKNKLFYR